MSCPPNTSGSTTGSRTNAVSSGTPSLLGTERNRRPARDVQQPERHEHQGDAAEQREDVQGRRPVQVDGAEDLEHEHHREQRDRPVEDVLGGRVVLGQQGQPRAPEAAFELADPAVAFGRLVHDPYRTPPPTCPQAPRIRDGSRYAVPSGVRQRARDLRPPRRCRVHVRRDRRGLGERRDRRPLLRGHRRLGRVERAGHDARGDAADPRARAAGGGGGARRRERVLPRVRRRRAGGRPGHPQGRHAGRAPDPAGGARRARPLAAVVREPATSTIGTTSRRGRSRCAR